MAQANIKAVITAEDRASGALKGFGDNVSSVNDKIVAGAKKATLAMGAALTAATGFSIKSAADFEQTRIGLENMLGSADKARVLLKDISRFAAETPFEFPELAQATRQLVAFGFTGEDAFKTMKQLGNVSAAVGAPINDLAYLMGTLRAQGRAFTIDIRQFAMRGIPIYEQLGKVLGKNTEQITAMIEAGQIGFPEVQKAFEDLAGTGGKWGDTMSRQSKSLSGLFSTLKDNIGQAAREFVGITREGDIKEGSVFAKLRDAVDALNRNLPAMIDKMKEIVREILPQLSQWAKNIRDVAIAISDYLGPKLEALWNTIETKVIPVLTRLWKEVIVPLAPVIGTILVTAIGGVIDVLNGLFTVLVPIIDWMLNNKWVVLGFAAAFGTLAFAMKFNDIVAGFRNSMDIAAGAMNAIRTGALAQLNTALTTFGGFGVIAAAAAIAAGAIIQAANDAKRAWDNTMSAVQSASNTNDATIRNLQNLIKTGTPEQQARARKTLSGLAAGGSFASGTSYAPGGLSLVGEQGPELVNLPRGSQVIPNNKISGGGGTVNVNINVGALMGSDVEARKFAMIIKKHLQEAASAKNMSLSAFAG